MSDRAESQAMRSLTVIAQDPGVRVRGKILTAELEVPAENLNKGPAGYRVQVIDYDATRDRFIKPGPPIVEDPFQGVTSGLVENPRFHAQNGYAIVMSILARFERALGRRVRWGFDGRAHQIKVVPHAFADANAYYSREQESLMFGYFAGARRRPIFTCLSHDIVAHEATHALIDGLRSQYLFPSSPDQAAFHEGFSDVVALLSVFRQREVVDAMLQMNDSGSTNSFVMLQQDLTVAKLKKTTLLQLAEQMGDELTGVRGQPLRNSLDLSRSPKHLENRLEAHDRGEILVAAMLHAFLEVWVSRLFPNGRRGVRALDRIHVVREGAKAADHLLTIAIRALDYTPPVDLQFGEYVSALLTADAELNPDDSQYGYRDALRKEFAAYGMDPEVSRSIGEEGTWNPPTYSVSYDRNRREAMERDPEEVFRFVWENQSSLGLDENAYTFVQSVRPTVRVNADGFVLRETVAEYVQQLLIRADELKDYDLRQPDGMKDWTPVVLNGGGALVFDDYGQLKLNIGSGVRSQKQQRRIEYLFEHGHFDDTGARPTDLAEAHRLRGGGPGLSDPYLERND